jgi:hypothetical protein
MDIEGVSECSIYHPRNKLRNSTYELDIITFVSISKGAEYEVEEWLISESVEKIHPYEKLKCTVPFTGI